MHYMGLYVIVLTLAFRYMCGSLRRVRWDHPGSVSTGLCGHRLATWSFSDRLISISIGICRHVVRQGGNIYWEWPPTSALWDRTDVQELLRYVWADYCDVSTASRGMSFQVKEGDAYSQRFLKKCWRIATNNKKHLVLLEPHMKIPELSKGVFV